MKFLLLSVAIVAVQSFQFSTHLHHHQQNADFKLFMTNALRQDGEELRLKSMKEDSEQPFSAMNGYPNVPALDDENDTPIEDVAGIVDRVWSLLLLLTTPPLFCIQYPSHQCKISPNLNYWNQPKAMNGYPNVPALDDENDTPIEDVAGIVDRVASKADEWKATPLHQKIHILHQIRNNVIKYQDEWETLLQRSRGVDATNPLQAYARMDVNIAGPYMLANFLNGVIANLEAIETTSCPLPPVAVRNTVNG
eukprot:CAMPEP_0198277432 /NCGR_PEP_ID=MMETSP1447-20131203/65847_1 /TAXON_ID=420782 /ORGANISM="Chaetoceros dichaeta, Strain CCMP1751" /LENGTH=250 /DNA_ID=CAMNT_0043972451 /DNA_START=183 /DNA_END=932 /DNA_ORIENTATION=+